MLTSGEPVLDRTCAVWWLTGPPCAGKSATAWEVFAGALAGRPRAFFDVDQLGMCYPAPEDGTARAALKARASAEVARHHLAEGAGVVVVSGVLDDGADALVREALRGVPVRFCRVRADAAALRARLLRRYGDDAVDRAVADARRWDASDLPAVDTTDLPVAEAARRAVALLSGLQQAGGATSHPEGDEDDDEGGGRAVLLCGAPGVGTSTAGFGLASRAWARGETCTYLDGRQLSFAAGTPGVDAVAGGVAALVGRLWRTYRAAGAELLVVRAEVRTAAEVEAFRTALAGTPVLAVRLVAGAAALGERVAARARGEAAHLAGDELHGLDGAAQRRVVADSLALQAQLGRAGVGDVALDTDAMTADAVVAHLAVLDDGLLSGA